jgi:predicted MFS family arabinose efflux permease
MTQTLGASTTLGSLALTIFWAAVTAGRILFAAIGRWFPEGRTYRLLPFVIAVAFVIVAFIPKGDSVLGILSFGLAGLGCSALLPLTISFGQKELTPIAASVAGGLIAFYQIGYGIGAFGVGPLQNWAGLDLNVIFGATALVALLMSALSFAVVWSPADRIPLTVTKEEIL